jgi:tetratricopeptide (TPR) repeat protein
MPKATAPVTLDDAYQLFEEDQHEEALEAAEAGLKASPGDLAWGLLHAACVDALGDPEASLEELEALCRAHPEDPEVWLRKGELLDLGLEDPEGAAEAFRRVLDLASRLPHGDDEMVFEAHMHLLDVCLDLGKLPEALESARAAQHLFPDNPEGVLAVGRVQFEMCRVQDAARSADKALSLDREFAGAHYLRGLTQERRGDLAGAQKSFSRAAELDPESFVTGVEVTAEQLVAMARDAAQELPPAVREYVSKLEITVEDLPADADVKANPGDLSPLSKAGMRGEPLTAQDGANPFDHLPQGLTLYRRNLSRGVRDLDELRDQVAIAMLDEVSTFLHLSEDQVVDSWWDR